jgi:hypothetical protein
MLDEGVEETVSGVNVDITLVVTKVVKSAISECVAVLVL